MSKYLTCAFIGSRLGMLGAVFVSLGMAGPANIAWIIGNPLLLYHNTKIGDKDQMWMYRFFVIVAGLGVIRIIWGMR